MTHTTVQKEAAPGRGDVAQAGPAAAGASVKAGLRGMSYEAREALQFKRTPVQRNEGPGHCARRGRARSRRGASASRRG